MIHIKETNLEFLNPLVPRYRTNYFIIHHVGPLGSMDKDKISAKVIHDWHLKRGWSGCGYHYVIRTNGVVERGRHHKYFGAHCYGSNFESIGICVVGDFDNGLPTVEQVDSLQRLLVELAKIYRVLNVIGHRDRNENSACPGMLLYNALPSITFSVRKLLQKE